MRTLKSIRVQLVLIMLSCYLIPIGVLGGYMGSALFTDLREKTETALTSGAEYSCDLTVQRLERSITLARDATYDGELTQAAGNYDAGTLSKPEFLRQARNYIERKYSREDLFTFAMFYPVSDPTLLCYNRTGYDCAMEYMRSAYSQVLTLTETLDTRCLFLEAEDRLYLVRNLMNQRMERFGVLILGLNREMLYGPLHELADEWDATLTAQLNSIGSASENDCLPDGLSDTENGGLAYARYVNGRDYDLAFRLSLSRQRLYGEFYAFRRLMTLLLALLIPVMALLIYYVHRRIVKPITLLSHASQRIEAGELGVTVPMHGGDELGDLGVAFSNMSRRIADLIDKTYKEEIALRDARIQAMQSRINPHFINNALETLNWEARIEGSETMSQMVESLSVLLNAGMGRGNRRIVPLREEIEVSQAYFYFIGLRFGERLTTTCEVAPKLLDAQVPLMTIQPLLENAVEHGVAPSGGGAITLICEQAEDELRIRVLNTGKGITAEDRTRLNASLRGNNQEGSHLGLANIANRLRLIYGENMRFVVYSDAENRTVAEIDLPLTIAKEDAP